MGDCRYFFHPGIRFECIGCGTCCTGEPGVVTATLEEGNAIARHLRRPLADLTPHLLIPVKSGYHIREYPDGRCTFHDQGCRIYPVRPRQCRTYPFWVSNLRSRYRWKNVVRQCPGIGQGRRYTSQEILAILNGELAERENI